MARKRQQSGLPSSAEIAKLLASLNVGRNSSIGGKSGVSRSSGPRSLVKSEAGLDLFGDLLSTGGASDAPSGNLAIEWAEVFEAIYFAAPDEIFDEIDGSCEFHVTQVFPNGEIHAICTEGELRYPVFAKINYEDVPAGCGCLESFGEEPCVHAVSFVEFLWKRLENRKSRLHMDVNEGRFAKGEPDHAKFKPNKTEVLFGGIDRTIAELSRRVADGDVDHQEDTFAPRLVTDQQRLAWRFELERNEIDFYPILQQPKKRGGGYTKGRRVGLENLLRNSAVKKSAQDRRVLDCITFNESYYRYEPEAELSLFQAMEQLIGADNVFCGTDPLTICRGSLEFEVMLLKDRYCLLNHSSLDDQACRDASWTQRFTTDKGQRPGAMRCLTAHRDGPLLHVDMHQRRVTYIDVKPLVADAIMGLVKLESVPADQGPELAKRLATLQSEISIKLPETMLGPVLPSTTRSVVLLRSNADGSLDVALRVRDEAGRLRKPGAAPAITDGKRDGKRVQLQRDLQAEIRRAESLAREFHFEDEEQHESLVGEQYATQITNFSDSLDLIDRLQSWNARESKDGEAQGSEAKSEDLDGSEGDSDVDQLEVLWDRNSEKPVSVLGSISSHNVKVEISKKRDWFGITGECEVGGKNIKLADLLENLAGEDVDRIHGDFIRLKDGQWARIGEKLRSRLRRLRDATHSDRKTLKLDATAAPAMREVMGDGEIALKATKAWQDCLKRLARAETLDPQLPASLDATLRDYQVEGYKWLRRLAEWGVGGILADDMGLGKTLQTLAVILDRKDEGPTLVIAPTSVGFNWVREAERFAPGLNVHLYRETDRKAFLEQVAPGDLVVCSYGLALRDEEQLAGVQWATLVLDEAQAIKNSRSKTSRAIAGIPAQWKVALTGTPVENHLGELWSLFHVVSPGVFGGWESFRKRFAAPIEKNDSEVARLGLAERLKPFVLRRKKSEVLSDLPPRTEMNLYVDLSAEERAEYERIRLQAIGEVDQLEAITTTQDQRFRILAMLTRLRQISCHAAMVNKDFKGESAKLQQLTETLEGLKEEGHRALIFSQFTEHLGLIRAELDAKGFTYEYLDGSTPAKARQERVDAFQNGTADAFLISLKAGGTGLNLTAADYVIHMDPWWNPAVEDQATDRAHRMGQDKPVMVYRIIAKGTIEEEILSLHENKRDLVAGVMEGTTAAGKLSNEELIAMFRKR
ncbi:Superfamily II DNA or RNA helicase, SNF2 family [Neorhodopirellula lusitana]|uniref:Superfamily II DNA or RNA helicase, SNF2 family n=1 Tax=Neorhodopirellula lusitana TaxID=445327 RepID=A0ABY1PPQ6_9BACT|nr:DEAD/DEAH box helicase [Neorhodopirellula lusitana]SMP37945.1 Superfamily II DNA or RNA helicase, SNF2 family [Neorhodopirellula lusitana]